MTQKPVFILGAPRSGTTFLASLLQRTHYGAPFETHFITKYYKKLGQYGDIHQLSNFNRLLNDILSERAVMQWKLDLKADEFFKELGEGFSYADLADQLCLKAANKIGLKGWGDKTPNYLGDVDILSELFPDSKYLYIVRDGRDVALSLLEKDWGPNNVYYCAQYWELLNKKSAHIEKLKSNGQLYQLKYEDLLDNVEAHVKEIYHFLDLKYEKDDVIDLLSTVKKGNYNKWKDKMSVRQKTTFDRVAANTLRHFGYETCCDVQQESTLSLLFYKLHHLYFRARHLFIINVVDGIKIKFFGKDPFAE